MLPLHAQRNGSACTYCVLASQTYSHSSSSCALSWLGSAPEKAATRFPPLWNVNIGCAAEAYMRRLQTLHVQVTVHKVECGTAGNKLQQWRSNSWCLSWTFRLKCNQAQQGQHHRCHARLCHCSRNIILVNIDAIKLHLLQEKGKAPHGTRYAACSNGLLKAERRGYPRP